MLRTLFATTAVAALLAVGAQAQQTTTDPAQTPSAASDQIAPDAPLVEAFDAEDDPAVAPADEIAEDPAAMPGDEGTVAEDPAATPADEDTVAEDPAATPADEGTIAADPAVPADETIAQDPAAPAPPLEEGWSEVDVATISTDTLIGNDIRTYDQEKIASVQDVLLTPDGQVENIVARFGGLLGFGETTVLLGMDEITIVKDADERMFVLTNLTPESLEERPVYEEEPAG